MTRESRWWLIAAGAVAIVVAVVAVVFGVRSVPSFPRLDEPGAPTIEATVAVVRHDEDSCLYRLEVATGITTEVLCEDWLWIEDFTDDGRLIFNRNGPRSGRAVVDLMTGEVEIVADQDPELPRHMDDDLRGRSRDGRATLTDVSGPEDLVLIDIEGPRMYGFFAYGRSGDWVWVVDSEERLLVVSADGSNGPWLVAEDVQEVAWR